MTPKCIIVLGMHRSATSLIAGGLTHYGVKMGKRKLDADRGNIYGYYEDLDFLNMNKRIFKIFSSEWFNPPTEKQIKSLLSDKILCGDIKSLIKSKHKSATAAHKNWGWKDPRTSITIPLYDPYLPEDTIFVMAVRSIKKIAESLEIRNGFNAEKSEDLAIEYNRRALDYLQKRYTLK